MKARWINASMREFASLGFMSYSTQTSTLKAAICAATSVGLKGHNLPPAARSLEACTTQIDKVLSIDQFWRRYIVGGGNSVITDGTAKKAKGKSVLGRKHAEP
jgi:hypothetical protein